MMLYLRNEYSRFFIQTKRIWYLHMSNPSSLDLPRLVYSIYEMNMNTIYVLV